MSIFRCVDSDTMSLNGTLNEDLVKRAGVPVSKVLQAVKEGRADEGVMKKSGIQKKREGIGGFVRLVQENGIGDTLWARGANAQRQLFRAVDEGNIDRVKMLIGIGVDLNVKNDKAKSPLFVAVMKGDEPMVNVLLEGGADTEAFRTRSLTFSTFGKVTPLSYAVEKGQIGMVKSLIAGGASVNLNPNLKSEGLKPLALAAILDNTEMLDLLIKTGADVNAHTFGVSPLGFAARSNKSKAIMTLLKSGAEIENRSEGKLDCRSVGGWTPLMHAASVGSADALETLRKAGANVNACSDKGVTALDCAVTYGHQDTIDILLSAGADPEAMSNEIRKGTVISTWREKNHELMKRGPSSLYNIACANTREQLLRNVDPKKSLVSPKNVEAVRELTIPTHLKSGLLNDLVDPSEFKTKTGKETRNQTDTVTLRADIET